MSEPLQFSDRTSARVGLLVAWTCVSAMVGGLAAAAAHSIRLHLLHKFAFTAVDEVWMAPLANVVLFAVLALPFVLLHLLARRGWSLRVAVGAIAFFGALSAILQLTMLHPIASVLVSLGIAARLTASIAPAPDRWLPRLRTAAVVLALFVVASAIVVRGRIRLHERSALAALPPATAGAPNVLLLILDTVRAADMSLYGYARTTTPVIDSLAASSTVFDRAISAAPWTLPSHASLFTGRGAGALSTSWETSLDDRNPTLAELFAARGYRTGGFVGNLLYTSRETGLQRGFAHYEDYTLTWRDVLWSATLMQTNVLRDLVRQRNVKSAARSLAHLDIQLPREPEQGRKWAPSIVDDFLAWESGRGTQPYFAFINLYDAHEPFPPPEPWASRFSKTPKVREWYDGGIAFMDHELGRLVAELRRRGSLDNTLVIITADHGEQFGENGWNGHGNSLYLPSLHVPLVVRWPGTVPAGRRVASLTSLRDLGATIVSITGGAEHFPGHVIETLRSDSMLAERPALSEVEPGPWKHTRRKLVAQRSVVSGDYHFIHNIDGTEELYHLRSDPVEQKNLASDAGARDTLLAKREALAALLRGR